MSDFRFIGPISTPKYTRWKRATKKTLRELLQSGDLTPKQKANVKAQLGGSDPVAEFLDQFDGALREKIKGFLL